MPEMVEKHLTKSAVEPRGGSMIGLKIYLIYIGALSLVTLVFYGIDKARAVDGAWRIPEKVLLILSAVGGALGGLCAIYLFRHKTRKWYFPFVNIFALVVHVGLLVFIMGNAFLWW